MRNINDVTSTASTTRTDDVDAFDLWWASYPKKQGKLVARKAYAKAAKAATHQQLLEGLVRYADSRDVKRGYVKNATTWLNGGHWADEAETTVPVAGDAPTAPALPTESPYAWMFDEPAGATR